MKAIVMPIVSPMDSTWDEFGKVLTSYFQQTTAASNWTMTQLYSRDVVRTQDMVSLPPMKRSYFYPEARTRFPGLPSVVVAALERSITKQYLRKRYEVVWLCAHSLPSIRYPRPLPVPRQAYSLEMTNGTPCNKVRLAGKHYLLRLKGGARMRAQLILFKQIIAEEAVPAEMAIYRSGLQIMCNLAAWAETMATPARLLMRTAFCGSGWRSSPLGASIG